MTSPFVFQDVSEHGIGLCGRMVGECNSSTRMVLVGAIVALRRATPMRIAFDIQSLIDKATYLKTVAMRLNADLEAIWWPTRNPTGRPWGLQPDRDLWKLLWEALLTRGPSSVTWQKFKGHATAEQRQRPRDSRNLGRKRLGRFLRYSGH